MLGSLLGAIAEIVLNALGAAVIKILGLDSAYELVASVVGLAFIVTGVVMFWQVP